MTRRIHKWLGALLLLPLIGWSITGVLFLVKPGYGEAYTRLDPRFYPMVAETTAPVPGDWLEVRTFHTILGQHLLARNLQGWRQYDPRTQKLRPEPTADEVLQLLQDAISVDPQRYGGMIEKVAGRYITETGVELSLDWHSMDLQQYGRDRAIIDTLYNVHYLRWTGIRAVDNVLGIVGLLCLIATALLGARLVLSRPAGP